MCCQWSRGAFAAWFLNPRSLLSAHFKQLEAKARCIVGNARPKLHLRYARDTPHMMCLHGLPVIVSPLSVRRIRGFILSSNRREKLIILLNLASTKNLYSCRKMFIISHLHVVVFLWQSNEFSGNCPVAASGLLLCYERCCFGVFLWIVVILHLYYEKPLRKPKLLSTRLQRHGTHLDALFLFFSSEKRRSSKPINDTVLAENRSELQVFVQILVEFRAPKLETQQNLTED